METKVTELSQTHNKLVDSHKDQEAEIKWLQTKIADIDDRTCRNNVKFRGIPETVQPTALNEYLQRLPAAKDYELIIDRTHHLPKPKFLPDEILRDVFAKVHFFHIKEQAMAAARKMSSLHSKFKGVSL